MRTFVLGLVLFISITCSSLNASDQSEDYDQEKFGDLFKTKISKIEKGGHLKKLLEKFLENGTIDNIELISDSKKNSGRGHYADKHYSIKTSNTAQLLDTMSSIALTISKELVKSRTVRSVDNLNKNQVPSQFCPFLKQVDCDQNSTFRSIDGKCNNLKLPLLGGSNTPYKRYLEPAYSDGLEKARSKGKSGKDLPSPRVISKKLFVDNFLFDNNHTHIIAFFGQFITHDFTMASVSVDSFGIPLTCACDTGPNINCLPIQMPSDENIMKMTCMSFTRSSTTFSTFDCKSGHREQLNLLTHYIDGSQIYGSDNFRSLSLREMKKGLLKSSQGINPNKLFLPQTVDGSCRDTNATIQCFKAGETRVNNNLGLVGLHTLFLREHNRVATKLQLINPDWSDDRLFNEARRIVIAEYQHMVFTQYLPALIGQNFLKAFELDSKENGEYYTGYNQNVNPSVANEFSTAAFRFGHSLIRSQIGRYNMNNLVMSPSVSISNIILRPTEAYNKDAGGLDSLFISIINEPPSKFDTNIADTLQNHLFEVKVSDQTIFSDDLAALNINRGRDHGIPSYNSYREKCGFKRAASFDQLIDLIDNLTIIKLQSTYEDVDDIDLYVGGLSETPINGGLLGPIFSCIVALQFRDFKKGDRYFYESGPSATAFSKDQLIEIQKSSLAGVICNNFDLNFIQPNVFYQPLSLPNNTRVPCNQIPDIDFSKWKEAV